MQSHTNGLPAVDVVIATHNRPQLLNTAIDAVLNQTYEGPIHCIIVFDRAEPDTSLSRSAPNRSVRVVRNDRSPGLAGARNAGVLTATSDYVAFCDDDDEWLPAKIDAQVRALQSSTALTSVTGIIVAYKDRQRVRVPHSADMTVQQLARTRVMEAHPSSVVVRRTAMTGEIGLVDEDIPGSYGEDYDWILRAAAASEIAVVEAPLVKVRWGQSLFSQRWQTIVDAIDYQFKKHPVFREDPRAHAREWGRRSFALAALGRRSEALREAVRTIGLSPRELRSYLAIAVALRLVTAERLMDIAHKRGHGI